MSGDLKTGPVVMMRAGTTDGSVHAGIHEYRPACELPPKCPPMKIPPENISRAPTPPVEANTSYDPPPAHYATDQGIDPWAVWKAFDLDPWESNLVKYVLRSGKKAGESKLKDLLKARNYLSYLIEREENR